MSANIATIIQERLKLQSTQRNLELSFSIRNASVEKIKSPGMLQIIKSWDETKKNRFASVVGGRVFTKETKAYLGI